MTYDLPHNQWGPLYATLRKESIKYTDGELDEALAEAHDTDPLRALWIESILGHRRRATAWNESNRTAKAQWRQGERRQDLLAHR